MFIIFGHRSSDTELRPLRGDTCPSCDIAALSSFTRHSYLHTFFIPLVPTGRTALASCSNCHQTFERAGTRLDDGLPPKPYSVFHFSGLVLAAILLLVTGLVDPRVLAGAWGGPDIEVEVDQVAYVLLATPALPTADAIVGAFGDFGGDGDSIRAVTPDRAGPAGHRATDVELDLCDGDQAAVSLVPTPFPNGEADRFVRYSLFAIRNGFQLPPHDAYLTVSLQGSPDTPPMERVSRFTSLVAAVVRASAAVGVYWPAAGATHEGAFFTRSAASPKRHHRVALWSGLMGTPVADGPLSILSLGMTQLALPDLYLVAPDAQHMQLLTTFYDLLAHLVIRGRPMGDGESIRFTDGRRLTGHYAASPIDPGRQVWRVDI